MVMHGRIQLNPARQINEIVCGQWLDTALKKTGCPLLHSGSAGPVGWVAPVSIGHPRVPNISGGSPQ